MTKTRQNKAEIEGGFGHAAVTAKFAGCSTKYHGGALGRGRPPATVAGVGPNRLKSKESLVASITVKMKDGTVREFPHVGRAGGSYTKRVTYEGAFVVIEDEYQKRIAIPATDVAEVVEEPNRRGGW